MKRAAERSTKRAAAQRPARAAKPTPRAARPAAGSSEIDAYLARLPPRVRASLQSLRRTIRAAAPSAEEGISYGMPALRLGRPLVAFAAFREHCSFFPMSSTVLKQFARELGSFDTSKGTIRFTPEKTLPAMLVKRIVRARIAENEARDAARTQRRRD